MEDYTGNLQFDFIDLKKWNLPYMDEPAPPMMGSEPVGEHTKRWSREIDEAEGFIFVTPNIITVTPRS